MDDSRETNNRRSLNSGSTEEISAGEMSDVMCDLEETLCTSTSCMDYTFWDPFTSEIRKFFDQMIIFKENRTSVSNSQ